MTAFVILYNAVSQLRVEERAAELVADAPFNVSGELNTLDEQDVRGLQSLVGSFGVSSVLLLLPRDKNDNVYRSDLVDADIVIPTGHLSKLIRGLCAQRQQLNIAKLGVCFFSEFSGVTSLRYLSGDMETINTFIHINKGLPGVRFMLQRGYVQEDPFDPLLVELI